MPGTDKNERKLHPWLRVVKNGNRIVNAVRADGSTRVACSSSKERVPVAPIYAELAQQEATVPRWTEQLQTTTARLPKRLKLPETAPADDAFINVFIEFFPEQAGKTGVAPAEMERVKKRIEDSQAKAGENIPSAISGRRNFLCALIGLGNMNGEI